MEKIRLGFVPAHREPFDEDWAALMRQRCLRAFSQIPDLEIVVPDGKLTRRGCVWNDSDAEKAIHLFQEKAINGLMIGTMTFGDEVAALRVATAFRNLPVYLFATREGDFTDSGGRRSDSFCGTLSISSGLHRRQIPFVFGGIAFPEEEMFVENVASFVRTCNITKGFKGANIGLVSPRPERFETCIFSEDALIRKFQQRVVPTSLPDLLSKVNDSKDFGTAVPQINEQMTKQADLSAVNAETLKKIISLEFALKQFATEKKLSAMGVQCWTAMQSVYGISPCYAMGRLTDQGIMASCEVDIYGALTMLMQYLASGSATSPHFIDWTIQHQSLDNVFLAWHCGNGPPSLAAEGAKVNISYHSILGESLGIDRSYGTGEFQLKSGEVTLCRLHESQGEFKMLISTGQIQPSEQKLRGSWSWVKVANLDKLYSTLVKEGFTHHASLIHGNYSRVIGDSCRLLGIQTVIV